MVLNIAALILILIWAIALRFKRVNYIYGIGIWMLIKYGTWYYATAEMIISGLSIGLMMMYLVYSINVNYGSNTRSIHISVLVLSLIPVLMTQYFQIGYAMMSLYAALVMYMDFTISETSKIARDKYVKHAFADLEIKINERIANVR